MKLKHCYFKIEALCGDDDDDDDDDDDRPYDAIIFTKWQC